MSHIDPSEVAIIGIVYEPKWYAGRLKSIKHIEKIRGDLILYSLRYASSVGYKISIVDGGSTKTFQKEIKKINGVNIVFSKIHKRSPNRRRAVLEGSRIPGVKAIVMTEIEKVTFITDCIEKSVKPILAGEADIVVPKREDKLFKKTYPLYMYESESEGNLLYNEGLRSVGLLSSHQEDLDVFFGTRVFKNEKKMLKQIFSHYEAHMFDSLIAHNLFDLEEYSNGQFFPVVKALEKGYKVISVTVPFHYPEKQKENEDNGERERFIYKRRFQKLTIIIELMHFLGHINRKKTRAMHKV